MKGGTFTREVFGRWSRDPRRGASCHTGRLPTWSRLLHLRPAGEQFFEVIVSQRAPGFDPLVIEHEPLDKEFAESSRRPLPEGGAAGGSDAVPDRQDGVEVVVVYQSGDLPGAPRSELFGISELLGLDDGITTSPRELFEQEFAVLAGLNFNRDPMSVPAEGLR